MPYAQGLCEPCNGPETDLPPARDNSSGALSLRRFQILKDRLVPIGVPEHCRDFLRLINRADGLDIAGPVAALDQPFQSVPLEELEHRNEAIVDRPEPHCELEHSDKQVENFGLHFVKLEDRPQIDPEKREE